jgi:hypothetical protein
MPESPQARLTIGDDSYTLQFSRKAVRQLENSNMAPTSEGRAGMPLVLITAMFHSALQMHHTISSQKAEALLDKAIDEGIDVGDLGQVLVDLYQAVFTAPSHEEGSAKLTVTGLDKTPAS